jgi:hypothetical protein
MAEAFRKKSALAAVLALYELAHNVLPGWKVRL